MKIEQNILQILDNCEINEKIVYLPNEQLDRKTYMAVNKCLEAIGGKWNRKEKGHIFEDNPINLFENLLLTGKVEDIKKEFQFFETPEALADKMVKMAELDKQDIVLEPSAGKGRIIEAIRRVLPDNEIMYCELNGVNRKYLEKFKNLENINKDGDFLEVNYITCDKIIMNPPFSKQQDIEHILKAFSLLRNKGVLVSVVSESPFFRSNKKSVEFRKFLEDNNAEIIKNDEGTFKESGTMVNTRIIKILCK